LRFVAFSSAFPRSESRHCTRALTLPSSGQPKARFACFRLPLMSNVRLQRGRLLRPSPIRWRFARCVQRWTDFVANTLAFVPSYALAARRHSERTTIVNRTTSYLVIVSASLVIAACGGSSETEAVAPQPTQAEQYQSLLISANEARVEAVALAASGPCTSDGQCASLAFRSSLPPCYETTTIVYSLATPTAAAASAAAAKYNTIAGEAESIAPPSSSTGSCFENVDLRPLICLESSCQRGFRLGS